MDAYEREAQALHDQRKRERKEFADLRADNDRLRAALAAAQAAGDERDKIMMARGAEIGYRDGLEAAAQKAIVVLGHTPAAYGVAKAIRALSPPASAEAAAAKPATPAESEVMPHNSENRTRHETPPLSASGDADRGASASAGAPSEEERVSVPRRWLEQIRAAFDGPLPGGRVGDAAFIISGQISDLLKDRG